MKRRRSFSLEFKWETAGMVSDQGFFYCEICRQLGVGGYLLGYRNWKRLHRADGALTPAKAE